MQVIQDGRVHHLHEQRWIKIGGVIVLLILVGIIITLFLAGRPMRQAKNRSIVTAENERGLTQINDFYSSDLNHIFYTVKGIRHHRSTYIIMNKRYRPLRSVQANKGINQSYVISQVKLHDNPQKIINAAPTIFNGYVAWIVSYESHNGKLNYRTFKYRNGRSIQSIKNL